MNYKVHWFADDRVISETLIGHFRRIRASRTYAHSAIVLAVEIGSSWVEAQRIAAILAEYSESMSIEAVMQRAIDATRGLNPRWQEVDIPGILRSTTIPSHGGLGTFLVLSSRDKDGTWAPGVITGPQEKVGGVFELRRTMAKQQLICADEMVCANREEFMATFCAQLKNFRRDVDVPKNPVFGNPRVKYTGKMAGVPDDIASGVALCIWQYERMLLDAGFQELCSRKGWKL